LTPPALPRPPAWTWALTTHGPPNDLLRRLNRLLLGSDLDATGYRHAELLEEFFCLVFVQVHADYIPLFQ
jgi:hypothetical protein